MTDKKKPVAGRDKITGKFTKGNKFGVNSRRGDGVKAAVKNAVSPQEAVKRIRRLLRSKNEDIVFKALKLLLEYNIGKPVASQVNVDLSADKSDALDEHIDGLINDLLEVSPSDKEDYPAWNTDDNDE